MIAKTFQINNYKDLNYALPTDTYLTPKVVYMYDLLVKTGDAVKIGQVLAKKSSGFFDLPVHATVSGTVGEIKKMWSGTGVEDMFLEIFNDFEETLHESIKERSDEALEKMSKEDMINIIKDRSIIGLGGSAFPTYIKLETKEEIHHVVINAAECEPYLSSDYRAIKDFTEEIVKGLHYVMKIVGAKEGHIAVKKTKKTLIETLHIEMAKYDEPMSVKPLKDFYPQGWENATFKVALGIEVPIGKLPMEYGLLGVNVSTAAAIYNALKYNLPITERYVTMNGVSSKPPR